MRVAAVDVGTVRIGWAVGDELGWMAHPRAPVPARDQRRAVELLARLLTDERVTRVLVGLPRHLDGREGLAARRARRFADALERASGLPVELVDEWLSTREATLRLREAGRDARQQRERVDGAAAAVVLQAWLDARRGTA